MKIPIDQIAILNRQRKQRPLEEVQKLAASIQAVGLLHPPVVRPPHPDETEAAGGCPFVLMVGAGRIAAHHLLQRTEIEVRLFEDLTPIEARIAELDENIRRTNLSWQEETDARAEIDTLLQKLNPSSSLEARAEIVGVSKGQLSKDIALAKAVKADPLLKAAASKGSAIRTAAFKADINERIRKVENSKGISELRSKLVTAKGEEFIKTVPSQSVDLVFSDLPYGIDYFGVMKEGTGSGSIQSVYDDTKESAKDFIAKVVPEMVRVVKPTGWIVLFMCYEWHQWLQDKVASACCVHSRYSVGYPTKTSGACSAENEQYIGGIGNEECHYLTPEMPPWIWTRRGKGNHGHWPELHASSRYEMLVVVNGGKARLVKKPVENVLDFAPFEGERSHAMQKPHDLCREIIERTTVPGELVLDICFGSGAHLAAAASLGRDFLGCEQNAELLPGALTLVGQFFQSK